MCNLYSITKGQAAIIEFARAVRDLTGNLPPMPGVFPDYAAPVVRNAPDGVRELKKARWGTALARRAGKRPPPYGFDPHAALMQARNGIWST